MCIICVNQSIYTLKYIYIYLNTHTHSITIIIIIIAIPWNGLPEVVVNHSIEAVGGSSKSTGFGIQGSKKLASFIMYTSGQITIIPKPELRGLWEDSLTKPPFLSKSVENGLPFVQKPM